MDHIWTFRSAYDQARKLKNAQDEYCRFAEAGEWALLESTPFLDDLRWEMLVDVLRGRVKVPGFPPLEYAEGANRNVDFKSLLRSCGSGWDRQGMLFLLRNSRCYN